MRINLLKKISYCWKEIPEIPNDPILYFNKLYKESTNKNKVNLAVGAYKDDNGNPWTLPSVDIALKKIISSGGPSFGYLEMTGDQEFTEEAVKLAFGYNSKTNCLAETLKFDQVARTQSISGTGAVFIGYSLARRFYNFNDISRNRHVTEMDNSVWVPNLSWPIHATMAKTIGMDVKQYHYYDLEKREFNSEKYIESLKTIPDRSFVILHANGHNPTGFDISEEEWVTVAKICKQKNFLVLMDTAYQGFVSGDLVKDSFPVRVLAQNGVYLMVAQSFAKNMGLYGQRTGCLHVVCEDELQAKRMTDLMGQTNRNVFSTPPRFGSDIAKTVLKDKDIYAQWLKDIKTMADSMNLRRKLFLEEMKKNQCPGNWEYFCQQRGMFAFTHLKVSQIVALREKYSIFMSENGRMSVTGLNTKNVKYVVGAITDVLKSEKA